MSRYIEREKAIRLLRGESVAKYPISFSFGLFAAADEISKLPTADVVEVRHGHWISQEEAVQLDRYDLAYTCSVCGHCDWDCTESENFNFCPNCGAKMDGERREK